MTSDNFIYSSKTVEIAEYSDHLDLTNRLCFYDEANLNQVMLPYDGVEDDALKFAETLISQPVVAKYKCIDNQDDLGGHEAYIDEDGDLCFNTIPVGVHVSVEIKEDTVTYKGKKRTLPCLFATSRIWKRNKRMIAAIKRLYEDDNLHSSWEIASKAYEFKNGIKKLTEYAFTANALLGSTTPPAYGDSAKAVEMASTNDAELLIAEALGMDILEDPTIVSDIQNKAKEVNGLEYNNIITSEEVVENTVIETPVAGIVDDTVQATISNEETPVIAEGTNVEPEISQLTVNDLYMRLNKACREKINRYCYISFMFPEEHELWCKDYEETSELDMLRFTYNVAGDEVEVSEPEKVTLTVSIREVNATVSQLNDKIVEKDNLILNVSSEITNLKNQITELSQYKEKFDKAEQERLEAELSTRREALICDVTKSGHITRTEIEESEELSGYVQNLDRGALMSVLGERLSASISTIETSTVHESEPSITRSLDNTESKMDYNSIMKKFLGGK